MAAIDQSLVSLILNALLPTGAAGIPGTALGTPLGTTAMKLRLNLSASSASAFGTEIAAGTGYAAGGFTALGQSTASASGSAVGVPFTTQSATATSAWSIVSLDITHNNGTTRGWFGNFNGQPIAVAIGNTFQITGGSGAAAGVQVSLT